MSESKIEFIDVSNYNLNLDKSTSDLVEEQRRKIISDLNLDQLKPRESAIPPYVLTATVDKDCISFTLFREEECSNCDN